MNTVFRVLNNGRNLVKTFCFILFLCVGKSLYAQEIVISCTNKPLNEVLIGLRDTYNLMLSFDDKQLSAYKLSLDKKFPSPEKALDYLFRGLPLTYELEDDVYVIYPIRIVVKPKKFVLAGRILDKTNFETLPFASIQVNNTGLLSDVQGNFSFRSFNDSVFKVKISYLGYYINDTTLYPGTTHRIELTPSVIALKEIVIEGSVVARNIQTGTSPGISLLNHKIAYFLPGNGDNSIFNLLRLQPGILAAGEFSSDLIIWGSYEGQSQVMFDGFTLYGMKNFNDNISAVNPYMAKDIKLLKGGYSAEYGEHVGGIVDITGIDGNLLSPSVQFCINNMTLNGMLSVPFKKKSTLVLAYRQTYYELYNPVENSSSTSGRGRGSGNVDYYAVPDYLFRDLNIKYSGKNEKSSYYLSLYGGNDQFTYAFDRENQNTTLSADYSEHNRQAGGAAFYGFSWNKKNNSQFTVSYSVLQNERRQENEEIRTMGNQSLTYTYGNISSSINEVNSRVDNHFSLSEHHSLDAGTGILNYFTSTNDSSSDLITVNDNARLILPYAYIQEHYVPIKSLTITPGMRADVHPSSGKVYLQPRLSVQYRWGEYFKINSAAGLYNQFVSKNLTIDESANYELTWKICDNEEIPVLSSNHSLLGLAFNKNDLSISIEGYIRNTGNITRTLQSGTDLIQYKGDSRSRGIDVFVKKEFKRQTYWIAYTLSKTSEHFTYFETDKYLPSVYDQRHEVKFAALIKLKPFYLSANYVCGSGIPDPASLPDAVEYAPYYSRLDGSVILKFETHKMHLDAGISVLNILNRENIKFSNLINVPTIDQASVSIYSGAVPFTPALFLNLYY
jgi:hypothetical protein